MYVQIVETPLGRLVIRAAGEAVTEIAVLREEQEAPARPNAITALAARQLCEYFAGTRREFDLPLAPEGTAFQKRVWARLRQVPFGEKTSYGALARQAGCASPRAVGQAVGRNPILIVIPCHRVLAATGRLGGFSAGLWRKETLLRLEKIPWKSGFVALQSGQTMV